MSLLIDASGKLSWGPDRYRSGGEQQNVRQYLLGENAVAELKIHRNENSVAESPGRVWLTAVMHPDSATPDGPNSTPRITLAFPGRIPPNDLSGLDYLKRREYTIWAEGMIDGDGSLLKLRIAPEDMKAVGEIVTENLRFWRFAPARKNGEPTVTWLRFPVVFVPPTGDAKAIDTLACLELLPNDSARPRPDFLSWHPITVPYTFGQSTAYTATLDTAGKVIAVTTDSRGGESLERFLKEALASWQFRPALSEERPLRSEFRFSLRPLDADIVGQEALPAPAVFATPAYPERLVATVEVLNTEQIPVRGRRGSTSSRGASTLGPSTPVGAVRSGGTSPTSNGRGTARMVSGAGDIPPRTLLKTYELFEGGAEVSYTINPQGLIQDLHVTRSSGQAFEIAVARALLQRRYVPGRDANGAPIPVRSHETLNFPAGAQIDPSLYFPLTGDPRNSAVAKPPGITWLAQPLYPSDALSKKQDGEAVAEFTVGRDGRTSRIKIVSATQVHFGESLRAALDACEFSPPMIDGRSAEVVLRREETFRVPRRSPPMLSANQTPSLVIAPPKSAAGKKMQSHETLDVAPKPVLRAPPRFPTALLESVPVVSSGEVVLELFIDADGSVNDARIVSATHPAFGYAALQASAGWFFLPGVKDGANVPCTMRVPVSFVLPKPN